MTEGVNAIFRGSLGQYNNTIIHEDSRMPLASPSGSALTTVRRAIFAGAQAGCVAFGRGSGPNRIDWYEELFDYGNQLGVKAGLIWGAKKMVFNSADFGVIALSSHAERP